MIGTSPLQVGATDWTLTTVGSSPEAVLHLSDDSGSKRIGIGQGSFLERTTVEFKTRNPSVSVTAPGGYTQATSEMVIKQPITLENGNTTVNTARVSLRYDPSSSLDNIRELRSLILQLVAESDYNQFWKFQSLG